MSTYTYDTGALLAAERHHRGMWALHDEALARGETPVVPAGVLAQAWRGGPQALLSRLLHSCEVEPLSEDRARVAGAACAASGTVDVVDASVVVGALQRGDACITSDPDDLGAIAHALGAGLQLFGI